MKQDKEDDYQPMTVKEAVALLSSLQSSQVIPVLRHSDFVMLTGLAFQGFRVDVGGYANPIVRRRLAEEAAKNYQFAAKLRDLSKEPAPASAPKPLPSGRPLISSNNCSSPKETDAEARKEVEKYRAERDRLKQERDSALQAKQGAERLLTDAKRELIAAQTAKAEGDREIERIRQRLERVERKQRQLETTNAALRKAAILPPPAAAGAPSIQRAATEPAAPTLPAPILNDRPFVEAVRHLLKKDRETLALSLVNDVLRSAPEDIDALEIKADALIKGDKRREAIAALRSAIALRLQHNEVLRAATDLYKLLLVSPQPAQETKLIRDYISALQRSSGSPSRLVEPIAALRVDNPTAFALVKSLTPPTIVGMIFPEQITYTPEAPLPLALTASAGIVITSRRLIQAIDRNDQVIVELAQDAIRQKDVEEREKILASITMAADGDPVYGRVLAPKFSRGPVVVDVSNVAWHGQEMLAQQQPRFEYILAIRRTLRDRGYFPVVLIADANLPYVINDSSTVRKMVDEEQIHLVLGGSDADEQILREAQRLQAPVVTNDYMTDWDPDQNITKIQYSFTSDGKPTIYF